MLPAIIALISLLGLSAFCSLSEAAILSVPFIRTRILLEQGRRNAKDLVFVKENLPLAISSLVIINNVVNISGSLLVGEMIMDLFGSRWIGIISAFLTFCIIVVGEIIPKTIGERYKTAVSLFVSKPLRTIMFLLGPLVWCLDRMMGLFGKAPKYPRVTEEEIRIMLRIGRDSGTVEIDEEVLCGRVFKLNDVRAGQIMTSLDKVYGFPADRTLDELRDQILECAFSRVVIYQKDLSDIVGVVQGGLLLRELAAGRGYLAVRELMMRPVFATERTPADTLMAMFQKFHQHLLIVQDKEGVNIGVVTMEDVLEELFGEIYDENDVRRKRTGRRRGE
ncbi:MAG: HlyC/CorC family transporter [Elusimicrobia bacterium]|nr:HlyC/CorC family transporter [Elusimicrobiota bacterium]